MELGFHSSAVESGQTQCAIVLRGRPWEVEVCQSKVLSGFLAHSNISKSEASALIDFATRFAEKVMV